MPDRLTRALIAEAIGTFTLCFVGILSISAGTIAGDSSTGSLVNVAFAHGLAIYVMVAALGVESGGHFNPAVTLALLATRRIAPPRAAMYVVAQLVGALLASGLIAGAFGPEAVADGTPAPVDTITALGAMVLEAVATFFLVLVIFGTALDERSPKAVFPAAIGFTITMGIMAIGPLTGAALNPARAFGPSLVSGVWTSHWIYWVGPILGGVAAALLQDRFLVDPPARGDKTSGDA